MPGRLFDGWLCPLTLQARFEAIEPQSERRQRQPEAVQFFRACPVRLTLVCTENPIRVYRMIESAKLAR